MRTRLRVTSLLALGLLSGLLDGQPLPIASDFRFDTPGTAPAVGYPAYCPTDLIRSEGGVLFVANEAAGLEHPCLLLDLDGYWQAIRYQFTPREEGIRVEFDFAINSSEGKICELSDAAGVVVQRIRVDGEGRVIAGPDLGVVVGSYISEVPFRLRIEIDADGQQWITTDPTRDGFLEEIIHEVPGLSSASVTTVDIGFERAAFSSLPFGSTATVDNVILEPFVPQSSLYRPFVRGDIDFSGHINMTDVVRILGYLFIADYQTIPCLDSADFDDDGRLNVTDCVLCLAFLFTVTEVAPAPPWPECGTDESPPDSLTCLVDSCL